MENLVGSNWPNYAFAQFILINPDDYRTAKQQNPDMPPQPFEPDDASIAISNHDDTTTTRKRSHSDGSINSRPHKSAALPHDAPLTTEEKAAIIAELPAPSDVSDGDSEFSLFVEADPDFLVGDCPPDAAHFVVDSFPTSIIDPEPDLDYLELCF